FLAGVRGANAGRRINRQKSASSSRKRKPCPGSRTAWLSSTAITLVQLCHGLAKIAAQQGGQNGSAARHGIVNGLLFLAAWRAKDKSGHLLGQPQTAWMANAQPQTPEIGAAKGCLNVTQAVMAGMPACLFKLYMTGQQI